MHGLNIDPNNPRGNPEPAELRELGVSAVRYTFYDSTGGDQLDPQKAQFYSQKAQAYREAGIESLVILTYDTYPNRPGPDAPDPEWDQYLDRFSRRSAQIAKLLAPWRPAFQVWNEPDHPVKGNYIPTLREEVFGRMLRRTRDAIKEVTPSVLVVTGGLAMGNPSWLTRVIQSQGGTLPADILAFHPYGQRPDRDWPHPNWAFGYVGDLLSKYYQAGQRKPIWITEMGVKDEDVGHNREQVAEFIHRYYQTMINRYSDKVQKLFWFCYGDGMVPPFGLVDNAGNRKPAFFAFLKSAAQGPARPAVQPQPAATTPAPPPAPSIATTPAQPTSPTVSQPPDLPSSEEVAPPPAPALRPDSTATEPTGLPAEFSQELNRLSQQVATLQGQIDQIRSRLDQLQSQVSASQPAAPGPVSPPVTQPAPPASLPAAQPTPQIENIIDRLKDHPQKRFSTRPLDQIQLIVIHHTAISPDIRAERIANYGVDKLGWARFRYHYYITGEANIQQTNQLTTLSDHAGAYSSISLGVGFAGDFTDTVPTPDQIEAGARLIAWLIRELGLSLQAVWGYKQLVNTQSPGNQWDNGARWGDQLKARIQVYL